MSCKQNSNPTTEGTAGLDEHRLSGKIIQFDSLTSILPRGSYEIISDTIIKVKFSNLENKIYKSDTIFEYLINDELVLLLHTEYHSLSRWSKRYYFYSKNKSVTFWGNHDQCKIYLFNKNLYFNFVYTYQGKKYGGVTHYNIQTGEEITFYNAIEM